MKGRGFASPSAGSAWTWDSRPKSPPLRSSFLPRRIEGTRWEELPWGPPPKFCGTADQPEVSCGLRSWVSDSGSAEGAGLRL